MNCFEWSCLTSDYLDGTLIGAKKRAADQHLENCPHCEIKFSRYRQLLNAINNQNRAQLLSQVNPVGWYEQVLKWLKPHPTKHHSTPWFIRGSVEGIGMAVVVLGIVVAIPKLKTFYDLQRQKRLSAYLDPLQSPLSVSEMSADNPPVTSLGAPNTEALESEFETDEAHEDIPPPSPQKPLLSTQLGEIWRFGIKTPSPKELRPEILKVLQSVQAEFSPLKKGGVEAPGGIQFDALIPKDKSLALKDQLQELARLHQSEPPEGATPAAAEVNTSHAQFTWYKNRAKKPMPAGKTRVIIWLSQI